MLNYCCCCISLSTGTVILAILNIIVGLGTLIDGIKAASSAHEDVVFIGALVAVSGAILLLVSIYLLIGALKEKAALLIPWLLYTFVFLMANAVLFIVGDARNHPTGVSFYSSGVFIVLLLYAVLEIYFLLVVFSLYKELKEPAVTMPINPPIVEVFLPKEQTYNREEVTKWSRD